MRRKQPLFQHSVRSHNYGSRILAWLLGEAAKIKEHFDVLVSVGSLETLRCHHASKLRRNSEQERTCLLTEDWKQI